MIKNFIARHQSSFLLKIEIFLTEHFIKFCEIKIFKYKIHISEAKVKIIN